MAAILSRPNIVNAMVAQVVAILRGQGPFVPVQIQSYGFWLYG